MYGDLPLLADPVDPVAGLVLQLRVPVQVEQEEVVPAGQVQTHAPSTQGQQHHLEMGAREGLPENLIPSFPWIAPHTLHPGAIQGKEGIKFCHLATLVSVVGGSIGGGGLFIESNATQLPLHASLHTRTAVSTESKTRFWRFGSLTSSVGPDSYFHYQAET